MVTVIASIRLATGQRKLFLDILNANVPTVRQEEGCLEYFPAVDVEAGLSSQILDENMVTIVEKWQSLAALTAHLAAPHMLAYRVKVKNLVEEISLKVLQEA